MTALYCSFLLGTYLGSLSGICILIAYNHIDNLFAKYSIYWQSYLRKLFSNHECWQSHLNHIMNKIVQIVYRFVGKYLSCIILQILVLLEIFVKWIVTLNLSFVNTNCAHCTSNYVYVTIIAAAAIYWLECHQVTWNLYNAIWKHASLFPL